jgi:hypothetical protein
VTFVVEGYEGRFIKNGKEVGEPIYVYDDCEVLWAPDSSAIIRTHSLGGLGPVYAWVFYVQPEPNLKVPDVSKRIREDFASRYPGNACAKDVNVGALAWEDGSNRAVLVAQVPDTTRCGNLRGHFDSYVVSIPNGIILARSSQEETIQRWHSVLSPELLFPEGPKP